MIPHDKALHALAGVAAFAFFHLAGGIDYAAAAVLAVAGGKEFADWYNGRGTPEWWDFIATLGGGALGFLCSLPASAGFFF